MAAFATPIELTMLGAPGCWLRIPLDILIPAAVRHDPLGRGIGSAHVALRIPNAPASLGACFYAQWFDVSPQGLTVSNGVKLEIASIATGLGAAMLTSDRTDVGPFPDRGRVEVGVMPVLQLHLR